MGPDVLDQWLNKISFAPDAAPWPTNAQSLAGLLEKDRQGLGLYAAGQYYFERKDFDRSAAALHTAMECRFLPRIFTAFANSEHGRGHPEEIVSYVKTRGPFALREGWVLMELALAESRCGDFGKAAAHYSQSIASCGYRVENFPPDCFEDYVRCLIKADHSGWASDRLKQRIAVDPSPLWPKMLSELSVGPGGGQASRLPTSGISAVVARAAPAPTGPPHLRSITWNPAMPSAQLDQNLVFEGDKVRGYKVIKILQNSVDMLTPEGASLTLRKEL